MKQVTDLLRNAQNILLTTHRQCDGDGLGAELAMYFALKKFGKNVSLLNVDATPRKYRFLGADKIIKIFSEDPQVAINADICLIFDTNDRRLLGDLYPKIEQHCKTIVFIDHHPILNKGPAPTSTSLIDVQAASTGELTYRLIMDLKIPLDQDIARALYTSITFDTQLYRFVRSSPNSHLIAAELLKFDINSEEIHRGLIGHQTVNKISFLAQALGEIDYHLDHSIAILKFHKHDLEKYNLELDESRDVIDMIMNIDSVESAVVFREDAENTYKISLRSKNRIEVLSIAEKFGGGGHRHAAGALVSGSFAELKKQIVVDLTQKLKSSRHGS